MSPSSLVCLLLVALIGGAVAQQCLQARVLGAGVVGLLSAVQLQKLGFNVTIHAYASPVQNSDYAYYASPHAGAWWSGNWNEYSYQSYSALMGMTVMEPKSTAITRKAHVLYVAGPPSSPSELLHQYYADYFRNVTSDELSAWGGLFTYGYEMTAVMVSAPDYTKFLLDRFHAAGGVLIHENITSLAELAARPNTDLVVSCPGLGARFLGGAEDVTVFPQRGQTLIMTQPNVTEIYRGRGRVDASDPGSWGTYILPRADGNIVVGGTRQENDWGTEVREIDTTNIMNRATLLHPPIANGKIVKYNVGFRPARTAGIRVELDTTFAKPVFHHYGHGGAGFEESWGSTSKLQGLIQARFPTIPTCPAPTPAPTPAPAPATTCAPCPSTPTCPAGVVTSAAGRAEPFFKFW